MIFDPTRLLQPLPVPKQVWSDMSMDLVIELPKAKGKDVILAVVDCLTKYAHFLAISHPFMTKEVAYCFICFISETIRLHGLEMKFP